MLGSLLIHDAHHRYVDAQLLSLVDVIGVMHAAIRAVRLGMDYHMPQRSGNMARNASCCPGTTRRRVGSLTVASPTNFQWTWYNELKAANNLP